jgi:hypothetical protein
MERMNSVRMQACQQRTGSWNESPIFSTTTGCKIPPGVFPLAKI